MVLMTISNASTHSVDEIFTCLLVKVRCCPAIAPLEEICRSLAGSRMTTFRQKSDKCFQSRRLWTRFPGLRHLRLRAAIPFINTHNDWILCLQCYSTNIFFFFSPIEIEGNTRPRTLNVNHIPSYLIRTWSMPSWNCGSFLRLLHFPRFAFAERRKFFSWSRNCVFY